VGRYRPSDGTLDVPQCTCVSDGDQSRDDVCCLSCGISPGVWQVKDDQDDIQPARW